MAHLRGKNVALLSNHLSKLQLLQQSREQWSGEGEFASNHEIGTVPGNRWHPLLSDDTRYLHVLRALYTLS
jgi:hypothetical protein